MTQEAIASGVFRFISNYGKKGFDINDETTWTFRSAAEVADLDFSDLEGSLITVVAVGSDGKIAPYSNRCGAAAAWCLAAPGGNIDAEVDKGILSAWQKDQDTADQHFYRYDEGTSMAAPHVSGAAAVVRSAFPYMTARQTIETILTTATDLGDAATYGQGLLNVGRAVHGPMEFRYDGVFAVDTAGLSSVWSNPISGTGNLAKSGAGTLTLTGANTYTGATTVTGGTLAIDGSGVSAVRVANGGTLAGTGTTARVSVARGGVLSPGSATAGAVGTLTVDGDLAQAAGSVYRAQVAADGADLVAVSGTATLADGARLSLVRTGAAALPGSSTTLLSAAGGVSGSYTLDAALADEVFLDYTVVSAANAVRLDVDRSDVAFASVARGFSQRSVAAAIDGQASGDIHDSLVVLDATAAQAAFTALSGEIYPSLRSVLVDDSAFLRGAAVNRLRAAFDGVAAPAMRVMAFAPGGAVAVAPDTAGTALWGRAFGAWSRFDGGDAADVDSSTAGLLAGGDVPVGDGWRVGALVGYSRTSFDADDVASSGDSDNAHLGLYAGTQRGALGIRTGLAYAWSGIDTDRTVAYDGFADDVSADFDARTLQVFGEAAYRLDRDDAAFEPYASLAYVHLRTDGIDEDGGAAALSASDDSSGTAFSTLGMRVAKELRLGGMAGQARADLGWRYAFGDVTPEMTLALADGTAFDSRGTPVARNAALIGLGLDLAVNAQTKVGLTYQGQFASEVQQNAISGSVTFSF